MRTENKGCKISPIKGLESEKKDHFAIKALEDFRTGESRIELPSENLKNFEIIIILSGAGSLYFDTGEMPISSPIAYLLTPGQFRSGDFSNLSKGYLLRELIKLLFCIACFGIMN